MYRILLVEDNDEIMNIVKSALEDAGYIVESASNGSEALECVDGDCPDLIVTDINMPVMDGIQLCRTIQEKLADEAPPVLLMTAVTKVTIDESCKYIDILRKPFAIEHLLHKIDAVLA